MLSTPREDNAGRRTRSQMSSHKVLTSSQAQGAQGGRQLSEKECSECELYQTQDWLSTEKAKRLRAFERERVQLQPSKGGIARCRLEFELSEGIHHKEIMRAFATNLSQYGIEQVRNTTVPAYTFTSFRKLPAELQIRIWFFAARSPEPQIHKLSWVFRVPEDLSDPSGVVILDDRKPGAGSLPTCLQICSDSRNEGLKSFARFRCERRLGSYDLYVNTARDSLYLGGNIRSYSTLLYNLVQKVNSPHPLKKGIHALIQEVAKIQNLVVDFAIFADFPTKIWTVFSKLEELVITYNPPFVTMDTSNGRNLCSGRVALIRDLALERFATMTLKLPEWKAPEVQVKVIAKRDARGCPIEFEEYDHSVADTGGRDEAGDQAEREQAIDDTTYLTELRERMGCPAWERGIRGCDVPPADDKNT